MYKRVDGTEPLEGFSYLDFAENEVKLELGKHWLGIYRGDRLVDEIAYADVPKLILALQECLKQHQEEPNID